MSTEHITFENDEQILKEVRVHWFLVATKVLVIIVCALIPGIAYRLLETEVTTFIPEEILHILTLLYLVWLLLLWMALFSIWTNYYLDVWTITTRRVIMVDQRGLFSRFTGSFRFEKLQDITVTVSGIIPTLLRYGTLELQTASDDNDFRIHGIPDPELVKALILEASDRATTNKNMGL